MLKYVIVRYYTDNSIQIKHKGEKLLELIKETVEYRNWGFNALTIGALGTLFFTFAQGWGLMRQNRVIWDSRSGESVNVLVYGYCLFFFLSFVIYGIGNRNAAITFNGLLFFLYIPIVLGLFRFKRTGRFEKISCACFSSMPFIMYFQPFGSRQDILLAFLLGILFIASFQPLEVWKNKDPGSVEPRIYIVFMATNIFWFTFALAIDDTALKISNPIGFCISATTLSLWAKYKNKRS